MTIRNNFLSLMMIGLLSNALYSMEEENKSYGFEFNSQSFSALPKLDQEMIKIKTIQANLKNNFFSDENLKLIQKKATDYQNNLNSFILSEAKEWNLFRLQKTLELNNQISEILNIINQNKMENEMNEIIDFIDQNIIINPSIKENDTNNLPFQIFQNQEEQNKYKQNKKNKKNNKFFSKLNQKNCNNDQFQDQNYNQMQNKGEDLTMQFEDNSRVNTIKLAQIVQNPNNKNSNRSKTNHNPNNLSLEDLREELNTALNKLQDEKIRITKKGGDLTEMRKSIKNKQDALRHCEIQLDVQLDVHKYSIRTKYNPDKIPLPDVIKKLKIEVNAVQAEKISITQKGEDLTKIHKTLHNKQHALRYYKIKLEADKDRAKPAELTQIKNNQNTMKIPDDTQIKKDPIIVQEQFQNQNPMPDNSILKEEYNSEFELESNYNPDTNEAQYRYSIEQIKMENKKNYLS